MEAKLEKKLSDKVIALGGQSFKWVSPNKRGVPDRIIFIPGGRIYFVETKFGRNGLSPQQRLIHRILLKLGIVVITIANEDELNTFILCLKKN